MKLAAFQDAIAALDPHRSWSDRRAEVAAPLTVGNLAVMLTTAAGYHHDARSVLLERLRSLGARGLDGRWMDDPEVHLGCPWFVGPFLGVVRLHWCADDAPSPEPRDWFSEDDVDLAVAPELQTQALSDDVTVVLTADHGVAVVTTSLRCEAPAWFHETEVNPAPAANVPDAGEQ